MSFWIVAPAWISMLLVAWVLVDRGLRSAYPVEPRSRRTQPEHLP